MLQTTITLVAQSITSHKSILILEDFELLNIAIKLPPDKHSVADESFSVFREAEGIIMNQGLDFNETIKVDFNSETSNRHTDAGMATKKQKNYVEEKLIIDSIEIYESMVLVLDSHIITLKGLQSR